MRALEEGRRRALAEQRMADTALTQDKERLALRSHVLTLREGEMEARIQDRDRVISELREQCALLTRMLKQFPLNAGEATGCGASSKSSKTNATESIVIPEDYIALPHRGRPRVLGGETA